MVDQLNELYKSIDTNTDKDITIQELKNFLKSENGKKNKEISKNIKDIGDKTENEQNKELLNKDFLESLAEELKTIDKNSNEYMELKAEIGNLWFWYRAEQGNTIKELGNTKYLMKLKDTFFEKENQEDQKELEKIEYNAITFSKIKNSSASMANADDMKLLLETYKDNPEISKNISTTIISSAKSGSFSGDLPSITAEAIYKLDDKEAQGKYLSSMEKAEEMLPKANESLGGINPVNTVQITPISNIIEFEVNNINERNKEIDKMGIEEKVIKIMKDKLEEGKDHGTYNYTDDEIQRIEKRARYNVNSDIVVTGKREMDKFYLDSKKTKFVYLPGENGERGGGEVNSYLHRVELQQFWQLNYKGQIGTEEQLKGLGFDQQKAVIREFMNEFIPVQMDRGNIQENVKEELPKLFTLLVYKNDPVQMVINLYDKESLTEEITKCMNGIKDTNLMNIQKNKIALINKLSKKLSQLEGKTQEEKNIVYTSILKEIKDKTGPKYKDLFEAVVSNILKDGLSKTEIENTFKGLIPKDLLDECEKNDVLKQRQEKIKLTIDVGTTYMEYVQKKFPDKQLFNGAGIKALQELSEDPNLATMPEYTGNFGKESDFSFKFDIGVSLILDNNNINPFTGEERGQEYLNKIGNILRTKDGRNEPSAYKNKKFAIINELRKIDRNDEMLPGFLTELESGEAISHSLQKDIVSIKVTENLPNGKNFNATINNINSILPNTETGEIPQAFQDLQNAILDDIELHNELTGNESDDDKNTIARKDAINFDYTSANDKAELSMSKVYGFLSDRNIPAGTGEEVKKSRRLLTQALKQKYTALLGEGPNFIKEQGTKLKAEKQKEYDGYESAILKFKKQCEEQKIDINSTEKILSLPGENGSIVQQSPSSYMAYLTKHQDTANKLANGKDIADENNKVLTFSSILENQRNMYKTILTANMFSTTAGFFAIKTYPDMTNAIKIKSNKTLDEGAINTITDIEGLGSYRSDSSQNARIEGSKQLAIQVTLLAISGGIGNIAASATLRGLQLASKGSMYALRIAKYSNIAKTGFWAGFKFAPELRALSTIVNGVTFHATNTLLTKGVTGEGDLPTLNPFGEHKVYNEKGELIEVSNRLGYTESVGFIAINGAFNTLTNGLQTKLAGKLANKNFLASLVAQTITLPGEIVGMKGTEVAIGMLFDSDIDFSPKSWGDAMKMVIGLRFAHIPMGHLHSISNNIEKTITRDGLVAGKDAGYNIKITHVEGEGPNMKVTYQMLDKAGNILLDNKGLPIEGIASNEIIKQGFEKNIEEEKKLFAKVKDLSIENITKDQRDNLLYQHQAELIYKNGLWKEVIGLENKEFKDLTQKEVEMVIGEVKKEVKIIVNPEIVKANASLTDPKVRIDTAKKLPGLENVTLAQEEAINTAHNLPGEVYKLNYTQIRARVEVLKDARLSSEQIRILLENGICGKVEDLVLDVDKNNKVDKKDINLIIEEINNRQTEIISINKNYENYIEVKVTNEVLDSRGEIYEIKDKAAFTEFLKDSEAFQSKFGIEPDMFEELTNNAFNYGAKGNPIDLVIKKVGGYYEFSIINLGKVKSIEEINKSIDIAKSKAELANDISSQQARLLQIMSKDLGNRDKDVIDLLSTEGKSESKKAKISEIAKEIIEKNKSLYKKLSEEAGTNNLDEIADKFAESVQGYKFNNIDDLTNAAGNGILFIREKTSGNISYNTTVLPTGEVICEARITVDAEIIKTKATKFNDKNGTEPVNTLKEEIREQKEVKEPGPGGEKEKIETGNNLNSNNNSRDISYYQDIKAKNIETFNNLPDQERLQFAHLLLKEISKSGLGQDLSFDQLRNNGKATELGQFILDVHNLNGPLRTRGNKIRLLQGKFDEINGVTNESDTNLIKELRKQYNNLPIKLSQEQAYVLWENNVCGVLRSIKDVMSDIKTDENGYLSNNEFEQEIEDVFNEFTDRVNQDIVTLKYKNGETSIILHFINGLKTNITYLQYFLDNEVYKDNTLKVYGKTQAMMENITYLVRDAEAKKVFYDEIIRQENDINNIDNSFTKLDNTIKKADEKQKSIDLEREQKLEKNNNGVGTKLFNKEYDPNNEENVFKTRSEHIENEIKGKSIDDVINTRISNGFTLNFYIQEFKKLEPELSEKTAEKLKKLLENGSLYQKLFAQRILLENKVDIKKENNWNNVIDLLPGTNNFDENLAKMKDKVTIDISGTEKTIGDETKGNPYILMQYIDKDGEQKFVIYSRPVTTKNAISGGHDILYNEKIEELVKNGVDPKNVIGICGGFLKIDGDGNHIFSGYSAGLNNFQNRQEQYKQVKIIEEIKKKIEAEKKETQENPNISVPERLNDKINSVHGEFGQGSIFDENISSSEILNIAKAEINKLGEEELNKIANGNGVLSVKLDKTIGYNLVLPIDEAKKLDNANESTTKKVEGPNTIDVPSIETTASLNSFATNELNIVIRPQKNEAGEVIPGKYIVLSVFPGDPNIPRTSEWNGEYAVVIPKGEVNKTNLEEVLYQGNAENFQQKKQ